MQSLRNWIGGQEQPDDITLVLARQAAYANGVLRKTDIELSAQQT